MAGDDRTPTLKDLDQRLKAARGRSEPPPRKPTGAAGGSGMAVGLQIAVELVAGVAVGVGLGWLLDGWLGTKPWLLIVFTIAGFAAGLLNVIRRAKQMEEDARRAREAEAAATRDGDG